MASPSRPYRDASPQGAACSSGTMARVPRPVTRAESRAWRAVAWGPSALAAYLALGTTAGCRPLGHATATAVLLGLLWGAGVYAASLVVRHWATRAWSQAQQALQAGKVNDAEARLRRICALTRLAPDFHAAAIGGLGQVAMRRGDLEAARRSLESALGSPWLAAGRADMLYILSSVHALAGRPAVGKRTLAEADALAPGRFRVWSALVGAYLAIADGAFGDAAGKLEAATKHVEDLQRVAAAKLVQALWAYCLQRSNGPPAEIRSHLSSALPLSRKQVGHYLRAWPELEAFLVAEGGLVAE